MITEFMTPILIGLKIMSILGIGLYVVFALIIVRQEHRMAGVLEESFESVLRLITYIHFVLSLAVLFMAFIFLPI